MYKLILPFTALLAVFSCGNNSRSAEKENIREMKNLTQHVDPFIGTGDHGHVFPGANVPFGMVQLGPVNISEGWDWCSGYHISDSTIMGFSHTHLSGPGIGDLGDIAFMPVTGKVTFGRGVPGNYESGMYSLFKHTSEKARPGYYAVHLDRYGIDVELTATGRVGFHKYAFPENAADPSIIIDLFHGIGWDAPVDGSLIRDNDTAFSGYRHSSGWANDQKIYFTAVFSKPVRDFEVTEEQQGSRKSVYGNLHFDLSADRTLYAKVALSPVSVENARMNMAAELPGWDFEKTAEEADRAWNRELNKIDFQTEDASRMTVFYTALYHTMIAPSEFCDVNGDYFGTDKQLHAQAPFTNYTTFSLWDTYRAAHPLMTVIHTEKMPDIIRTMLAIYEEQGKLPVWHLVGNETDCMVGNPGVCVVADAILKGFDGFDKNLAYEAMKTSVMLDERGQKAMRDYGYIPCDLENQSVAKTMEYAIADWSVAQVARSLGKQDDYEYFTRLSKSYTHFYDPVTRFMRAKDSQGKFLEPFNPFISVHGQNEYTEGNAWQYLWLVPHDVEGLVSLFGSREAFLEKLDSLFTVSGDMGEHASPDISGLIGQYAHGNEPSHHIIYMYAMVGEPGKTAEKVRHVLDRLYTDRPAGLCGNEDVGQMSAWYVLSALGFYQVEPAGGRYFFGSPAADKAVIHTGNGKTFTVIAKNNSAENKYIKSVTLNGKPYDKAYIDYKTIMAGGTLEFEMEN
ncbi:MAG: GH92 family glycosyl hydrolase [Bacteroidales bacterium]|jgi:predicted alpha-1,2-mannosidase|nr:GH92 family glycosyl hydrolase [Bacteroidales bacterium]